MAKFIFFLYSVSSDCLFWSVNHASISDNSELNVFKKTEVVGEIFDLLAANVYKTLESLELFIIVDNVAID